MTSEPRTNFEIRGGFEHLSAGYDDPVLRFFLDSSKAMVSELAPAGVREVLDIATGTGHTALELASRMPEAHVTGMDISQSMLDKAKSKLHGRRNVDFIRLDMEALGALEVRFDLVTFSFGLYFLKDRIRFFNNVKNKLNDHGRFVVLTFDDESFMPFGLEYIKGLMGRGHVGELPPMFSVINRTCADEMRSAGFNNIVLMHKTLTYKLQDPNQWWNIVCGTAYASFLDGLTEQEVELFKRDHLNNIQDLIYKQNTYNIHIAVMVSSV
jgi:ubiquinone/menaquinone biosynthesis C-methylase UbiE